MHVMPVQKPGRSKQDYGTPRDFLNAVEKVWGRLHVDLAATRENAKAIACFTPEMNSLTCDWTRCIGPGGRMWLNPPYEDIAPWAEKCKVTDCRKQQTRIFFLVPASIGAEWFAKHVWGHAHVYALRGRLTFEGCTQPYPKDCILAVYGEDPGFSVWDWRRAR